jgi:hypothetical protein
VKTGYHAFKIADKSGSDSAEINMNKHKKGYKKTKNNMDEVVDFQSAASHYFG